MSQLLEHGDKRLAGTLFICLTDPWLGETINWFWLRYLLTNHDTSNAVLVQVEG